MESNGKSLLAGNLSRQALWPVLLVLAAVQLLSVPGASFSAEARRLRVSDSGRHLVYENGEPFFWLADTGWQIFHRLTREEADAHIGEAIRLMEEVRAELDPTGGFPVGWGFETTCLLGSGSEPL